MASSAGGNFCEVTGQNNWCGSTMACDEVGTVPRQQTLYPTESQCPVQHWCVCQWAFAKYLERAGGCDKIQNIVCEATNMQTLVQYRSKAKTDPSIKEALQCLEKRCRLA